MSTPIRGSAWRRRSPGHRRAFGADTVPGIYEDLDQADLIVLVGSNAAWCHPVLFQRMLKNKRERGAQDRRHRSAPHRDAPRRPICFCRSRPAWTRRCSRGLLVHLADTARSIDAYIDAAHQRLRAKRSRRRASSRRMSAATAQRPGLLRSDVSRLLRSVERHARGCHGLAQGVNQSAQGTDKVNAIINCHLATGRIGRPGMGPFSLTGQPNAMGGREVGGLANQLAAHMGFDPDDVDRVRRFWNAPRMAEREGLKAVQMFDAIERGEIKALWVMATNPAVSLPRAERVREALRKLELFVVSENVLSNDTVNAGAHDPAAGGGVGREGRHGHQFRAPHLAPARVPAAAGRSAAGLVDRLRSGEAHGVRRGLRVSQSAADVFREHARFRLSRMTARATSTSAALADLSDEEFDALEPVQWPVRQGEARGERRFFAQGDFFTPDRKARFVPPAPPALREKASRSLSIPPQHRPHPRSVAHHDAYRLEPAAGIASARAFRGDPSDRRSGFAPRRWRLRENFHCSRRLRAEGEGAATASGPARCSCRSIGAAKPPLAPASAI